MSRAILGVIAGYAAWTILWLGGNVLLFGEAARVIGEGQAFTHLAFLVLIIPVTIASGRFGVRSNA